MATGPFTITEASMAMRLGVTRAWLREHRGEEGQLWVRSDDRQILYSEASQEVLEPILGPKTDDRSIEPSDSEKTAPVAASAAEAHARDVVTLVVVWCRFENRRIMTARLPDGTEATVWVLDARKFAPGMRVLATPRPTRPGVFDFVGNPDNPENGPRMPRRPGIW